MTKSPAPTPNINTAGLSVGIVAATWHPKFTDGLVAGAQRACTDAGISPLLVRVPGAFELPVVADRLAQTHDVVVALGVVIRGESPHFDYVCRAATDGLTRVALDRATPVGFGVLTCDTEQQAFDRAGLEGSREDSGYAAVTAALETAVALRELASL
ncbi:6,7-dimethyl-8-ribityllumazine synthase [Flaviflexus huanghaiensis]|uniref:6,7-dimethyl-8-ribityllumazine synthase n=1 Tax=Flaviflexus huanghaiensis TaxID=1111473 RepID=UPI0015FE6CB2|nr:6,7-dimethyl-8-ribityllumazine synthase [Flaviflexus huanghaiensis]